MKQSQRAKILAHLKDIGSLTQLEASKLYGVGRLASRINEMRKKHPIGSKPKKVTKDDGTITTVSEYHLRKEGELF